MCFLVVHSVFDMNVHCEVTWATTTATTHTNTHTERKMFVKNKERQTNRDSEAEMNPVSVDSNGRKMFCSVELVCRLNS